jgi:hypothetical protein
MMIRHVCRKNMTAQVQTLVEVVMEVKYLIVATAIMCLIALVV